jgi:hypothetical protein
VISIVTVLPLANFLPAPGLCADTMPGVGDWSPALTFALKPACCSAWTASSWLCPSTLGTGTRLPREIESVIVVPGSTSSPAFST